MENSTLGIIFALASTASWGLCTIIFKKLGERLDAIGMTTVKSLLSCIFLAIVLLVTGSGFYIQKEKSCGSNKHIFIKKKEK